MHWFPLYTADFIAATLECSYDEITTYAWMLVVYYERCEPFPADSKRLFRILRCESTEQKRLVENVLKLFFIERDGHFYQEKAEQVIEKQATKSKKAKDSANMRWQSERNATASETHMLLELEPELEPLTPKVKPIVRQLPEAEKLRKQVAKDILGFLNERAHKNFQPTAKNLAFITARLKEGATPAQCRKVIANRIMAWEDKPEMREYLRPATLFNNEKFNQYVGELVLPEDDHVE